MNTPTNQYDAIFQKYGTQFGVDWKLLKAVSMHESSLNPAQINYSDPSVGLMQVLCIGYPGTCQNRFNIQGWPSSGTALTDPDTNVYFGAQILAANIAAYGINKGIAVYNDWSSHTDPASGPFQNQSYVDAVLANYQQLQAG